MDTNGINSLFPNPYMGEKHNCTNFRKKLYEIKKSFSLFEGKKEMPGLELGLNPHANIRNQNTVRYTILICWWWGLLCWGPMPAPGAVYTNHAAPIQTCQENTNCPLPAEMFHLRNTRGMEKEKEKQRRELGREICS